MSASTVVTSVFSFFFLKRSETLFTSSGTRLTIWLLESGRETSGSTRTSPFETAMNAIGVMSVSYTHLLDGRMTAPAEFDIVSYEPGGDGRPPRTVVQIVLYEGRNRQIRRMCEELGLEVTRLRRIAVGTVKLGMLPAGKWRHLQPKEVRELLEASKVEKKIAASYIKQGREGAARAHHHGRR